MSREQLPEPWRAILERRGISSIRGLAAKAGISPQTAKRLLDGTGDPSFETVTAVAEVLYDGDRSQVYTLLGERRQDRGPWEIPEEVASQLDDEQRAAVLAVARAMLPAEVRKRGGSGGDTTATSAPVAIDSVTGSGRYVSQASQQLAARRVKGQSSGQRARAAQDDDAQGPQG